MKMHWLASSAVSALVLACSAADPAGNDVSELTSTGPACTPQECGPGPEIATKDCGNGRTAGPVCVRNSKNTCGWIITHCASTAPPPITVAPASVNALCPPGKKSCVLENSNGTCSEHCVPDNVMCVAPACPVCDPSPPPEQQGCSWDEKACLWICL